MSKQDRALEAVRAGAVSHAHPFTWAVGLEFLDVKPSVLQKLVKSGKIKVIANAPGYWRPVIEV